MILTITGLPRSGTAFLSTALNFNHNTIAFHELAAYDQNWRLTLVEAQSYADVVVNSCTYGHHRSHEIISDKNIMILSSPELSYKATCDAMKIPYNEQTKKIVYESYNQLSSWNPPNRMLLKKGRLFEIETLKRVWAFVFGEDEWFPEEKMIQLLKLKVEHRIEDLIKIADGREAGK
jgi:hypothetical protein